MKPGIPYSKGNKIVIDIPSAYPVKTEETEIEGCKIIFEAWTGSIDLSRMHLGIVRHINEEGTVYRQETFNPFHGIIRG